MLIGAYSILKPLKNPVFFSMVGGYYKPFTRYLSMLILPIAMLFYSFMVDKLRRYNVLIFFTLVYAVGNLVFAFVLNLPVYGLGNTDTSALRFLGWAFYIYLDLYQAFVVSTFWAFTASVCSPQNAKKNYGVLVACSKLAGILTPLLSLAWLSKPQNSSSSSICILISITSLFLIAAALTIARLKRKVPGFYLHGYEAVYKLEKEKSKQESKKRKTFKESVVSIFEGIILLVTKPYAFGIFFITCSYELISEVLDYHMNLWVSIAKQNQVVGMSTFNLYYTSAFQGLGLFFALFGTAWALRYFDVKKSLLITPIITVSLLFILMYSPTLATIVVIMILLRALNYGFNVPVREILYIPTVKDIKFKSRAWINTFGRTFSKASGSALNIMAQTQGLNTALVILLGVGGVWTIASSAVGEKYTKTVKSGGVIG